MGQKLPLAGRTERLEWIEVSPEMTAAIGRGLAAGVPLPPDPIILHYDFGGAGVQPAVRIGASTIPGSTEGDDADLLFLFVARSALHRLGGEDPGAEDAAGYHLPTELRSIALALRDCPMEGEARNVYRLAKSLELICETVRMWAEGALVPLAPDGDLSFADTGKLMNARRLIDERWHEKLTLDGIARACGLNRAKLTRGFRELFGCTIAEALAEQRLGKASRALLTTDKPVSSIGYENGYLNNASFARAFSRRFGVSPSDYRAYGVAA
ncbi:MAG TPA: AraC family transcriptional regulator [Allosphingosinicella sp.]|nr:AraC family transcriptional regulator [Allosphingosinicella sp.]